MAKNTDPKQTAAQTASVPGGKKSALPIIAAVLFLLSAAMSAYVSAQQSGTGFHPGLGTLLTAFLVIALFLHREQDLVPLALGLRCLNTLSFWVRHIVAGGFFGVLHYFNLTTLVMTVLTVLLALPNLRGKMRKIWWLPAALGAVIITAGTVTDAMKNFEGISNVSMLCLDIYGYLFLCAWLAYPNMTFKGMVVSTQKESAAFGATMLKWLVQGAGCGIGLLAILCGMSLVMQGSLDMIINQAFVLPMLLFGFPAMWCIYNLISAMRQGAKETKRMKHDMNIIKSSMGGYIGAQAKAELRKEAGKAAANAVIKGALIGDLIGGDTGAVVGAMAAKAQLDQTTGGGSVDGVAGDAVTGGLITGNSSAVVGGLAAQAQRDAENSIK